MPALLAGHVCLPRLCARVCSCAGGAWAGGQLFRPHSAGGEGGGGRPRGAAVVQWREDAQVSGQSGAAGGCGAGAQARAVAVRMRAVLGGGPPSLWGPSLWVKWQRWSAATRGGLPAAALLACPQARWAAAPQHSSCIHEVMPLGAPALCAGMRGRGPRARATGWWRRLPSGTGTRRSGSGHSQRQVRGRVGGRAVCCGRRCGSCPVAHAVWLMPCGSCCDSHRLCS
jgi:hypothetical protein